MATRQDKLRYLNLSNYTPEELPDVTLDILYSRERAKHHEDDDWKFWEWAEDSLDWVFTEIVPFNQEVDFMLFLTLSIIASTVPDPKN